MKKNRKAHPPFSRCLLKSLIVMKFILLLVLVTSQQLAADAFSQQVTIKMHNASFKDVTKEIEKQTSLTFLYNDLRIKDLQKRNVNVKDADYSAVLKEYLEGSELTFELLDNTVVILPMEEAKLNPVQQNLIKGTVTDSVGNALEGVSVKIKGTKSRTVSDISGSFELHSSLSPITLVFSFIGMKTQEVVVTDKAQIVRVIMKEDKVAIDDVVVTGYNNLRKESFTGSYTQVTREDLMKVSTSNLISALQVFDPSLRMMDNKGIGSNPNELPEFYVRGQSGFPGVMELDQAEGSATVSQFSLKNNPNLPIFIMDGFEVSLEKVFDLNLNRVTQITILKDAAATAVYGSRASNGVIVIETVAPKSGEFRITYNGNYEITAPDLSSYNMMNAQEKLDAEVAAGLFVPHKDTPRDKNYANQVVNLKWLYTLKNNEIEKGVDTYWLSQPLTTMFNQRHNLFFEGGSDAIRVGVDFRFDNQNGVMKESGRKRVGTGLTLEYRYKGLQVRNQTFFDMIRAEDSPYGSFSDYSRMQPYYAIHDEEGKLIEVQPYYQGLSNVLNPIYEATLASFSRTKYNEWTNNFSANWFINPYLSLKGQVAVVYKDQTGNRFIDPKSPRYTVSKETSDYGELNSSKTSTFDWNTNVYLAYNRTIDAHNLNLSSGLNVKSMDYEYMLSRYRGFPSGKLNSPSYANKIVEKPSFSDNKTRLFGSFTNLNYTFQNIYLFDASFRMDGSSEFGSERKWAPFWSLGTGLNLHNMMAIPAVNSWRIKANIGQTGKSNFAPFMANNTYKILSDEWYPSGIGADLIYMGNELLTWEKQLSTNIGMDLSIMNRYNLELNYYHKKTYDLVSDVSLPSSSGFSVYRDNIGKVLNKGVEVIGNFKVLSQRNWDVVLFGNMAHNKNKILEIAESLKQYNARVDEYYEQYKYASGSGAYQYLDQNNDENQKYIKPIRKYEEGSSLTAIYGMKSLGINPANGQEVFLKRNGEISTDWSALEQDIIGNTEPWAQGAFGLNVRFKQFSLYTSFLYEFGGDAYNETLVRNVENVNLLYYNGDRRVLTDRWQKPGDIAQLKSIEDRLFVTRPTSRFVQKNNYLAFNSLAIMYDVDNSFIQNYKLNSLRFGFNMNDIARFSTIKEERGLNYPFARTFTFSINTTF